MIEPISSFGIAGWLQKLEQMDPGKIELGLDRVATVAARMELTSLAPRVVSVAGTNGKGSCVCIIEQILLAAGYRVGAYTSPHILVFNERIRIGGANVIDAQLVSAFEAVDTARQETALTYFEFTTLAAFYLFNRADLDVVVLEVGLGGRLDAVNIVDADVAAVTNIALDHQSWLGNTREAIAREKAGIYRQGRPAICGDLEPPGSLSEHAKLIGAELQQVGENFGYAVHPAQTGEWTWWTRTGGRELEETGLPIPALPLASAATALQAIHELGFEITRNALACGLRAAKLPGRMQRFYRPVTTILDVAHNPAASAYLCQQLTAQRAEQLAEQSIDLQSMDRKSIDLKPMDRKSNDGKSIDGKIILICGILADKDIEGVVSPLIPLGDAWIATEPDAERAAWAEQVAYCVRAGGGRDVSIATTVAEALTQAFEMAKPDDLVVVFGSFYTVAEGLEFMNGVAVDG